METNVIWRNARAAVIELDDGGNFTCADTWEIFVNDEPAGTTNTVETYVDGLIPGKRNLVRFVCGERELSVGVTTPAEPFTINVRDCGAKGDAEHDDTTNIQAAIMACPKGGRVLIPAGNYRIKSLFLKSNINIELAGGAVLRARKGPCARSAFARARRSVASASLSLRDQETLPRGRLPRSLCSRRPCPANGCIRSLAHGRDHSAVSRASGSRCGLPNAPSGSPSEALRSPSRWAGKICIAAYKPSFLRFARRNDLALRTAQGEGEPLATARSRRVMGRSLRFAPITKRPRPRMGGRGLEVSVCRGNLASTCPS